MNRLALTLLALAAFALPGCGGSSAPSSGSNIGPEVTTPQSQNTDLPEEVRAEFKREEDMLKKSQEREAARASKAAKH